MEWAEGVGVGVERVEGEVLGEGGAGLSVLGWMFTPGALFVWFCAVGAGSVSEDAVDPPWLQAPRMRQAPSSAAMRGERG